MNLSEKQITLKTFQLRVAKSVLGIGVKAIGKYIGMSKSEVSLWEQNDSFKEVETSKENISLLIKLFSEHQLFFPNENTVTLQAVVDTTAKNIKDRTLTRFQLRASRMALDFSQEKLAKTLEISEGLIARAECLPNNQYIRSLYKEIPTKLKNWFESQNITYQNEFTIFFKKK